jgi:cyclopropane-fatty-acyl-phospholipid synthase
VKRAIIDLATLMHSADSDAQFAFELWDGEAVVHGTEPVVCLRFRSKEGVKKVLCNGFLGFGEAYMANDLEVEGDLQELLRLGICLGYDRRNLSLWQKIRFLTHSLATRNTPDRAPQNIKHHYDLGDEFYQLFLDQTLTYSCGYFTSESDSLEQAQLNKYEHICRKLKLQPGENLLDIGCGWGGMLIYAAQNYNVKGLGVTLSPNQYERAKRKIEELGLANSIRVALADYREIEGEFDKCVSIGMFEHVGKAFIPVFMKELSRLLKKGGIGLLHTIGKVTESPGDPWILKYIFPGGYIPNLSEIVREMGLAGFSLLDLENLRLHYAHTLDRWADNYERNLAKVKQMFDESFVRMWRLFLNASSAGFKHGSSRLYQILFSNGLNNELPLTRKHLYQDSYSEQTTLRRGPKAEQKGIDHRVW